MNYKIINAAASTYANPTISYPFGNQLDNVTLYVPIGCKPNYERTWWGRDFKNIVETDYFPQSAIEIIPTSENEAKVYTHNGVIVIKTNCPMTYTVFSIDGITVSSGVASACMTVNLDQGIYVVRIGAKTVKIIV